MGKKGVELQKQDLENVGGGWRIYHVKYCLDRSLRGYHIIYKGRKVGKTAQTEEEALQEAERLGLVLRNKRTDWWDNVKKDWWDNRRDDLPKRKIFS